MARPGGSLIRPDGRPAAVPGGNELVAALSTPLLAIDAEGLVVEANAAAEALLNLGRSAIVGSPVEAMIGHALTSMAKDAPFAAYALDLTLPGGRRRRADLTAAPLGERPGWRVLAIHLPAPANIAARRGEREGGSLAAASAAQVLAHEIKNPLSGIRGAAQLLEESLDGERLALTRLIRTEVDRVTALIGRMDSLADTRPLALGPQNIHAILGHVRDLAAQGFAAGTTIREIYDPSLPDVLGHKDTLVQVLLNLIKNAAEAIAPDGAITLTSAYRHGLSVAGGDGFKRSLPIEVCVVDDGPGAPADIADHLFDPFVTGKRTGSGLGLAVVAKLVDDLGGMVEYAREGEPARTVFRLLLPRAAR